jgi:hypothetical protein
MPVMDELGIERVKEALHRGVVIAVNCLTQSSALQWRMPALKFFLELQDARSPLFQEAG